MSAITSFIRANIAICEALTPHDARGAKAQRVYKDWAEELLSVRPVAVLDVGAGKRWHFDPALKHDGMRLIGLDIDEDEIANNTLLDACIITDACTSLEVPPASIDLLTCRASIEHFHDTATFLRNAALALKPGAHLIVTFPNKWAPFAIINRCIPSKMARWLLRTFIPGSEGRLGFKAYYDCCTPREFRAALTQAGLVVEREYASYFSSTYFAGVLPIYVLSLLIDFARHLTRFPVLSSYLVFVARRPQQRSE